MISSDDLPPVRETGWPWTDIETPQSPRPVGSPSATDSTASEPILVVTPSFNQGEFIEATLRSVILQKSESVRYVVVDAGSSDQTHQILEQYRDWIDELIIEPDEGQSDAILKGIGASSDGWFNWINSDDMLSPGVLDALRSVSAIDAQLVTYSVEVIGDGNTYPIFNRNLSARTMLLDGDYSFAQPGCWLRLERFHEVGGIDRTLQYGFDWDLMIRYLATAPTIDPRIDIGATFRVHEASKTATETQKTQTANAFEIENERICKKLSGTLPPHLASLCERGRQRRIWRHRVAEIMDDPTLKPHAALRALVRGASEAPASRCNARTWMSALRLLSRYFRPDVHRSAADRDSP